MVSVILNLLKNSLVRFSHKLINEEKSIPDQIRNPYYIRMLWIPAFAGMLFRLMGNPHKTKQLIF